MDLSENIMEYGGFQKDPFEPMYNYMNDLDDLDDLDYLNDLDDLECNIVAFCSTCLQSGKNDARVPCRVRHMRIPNKNNLYKSST